MVNGSWSVNCFPWMWNAFILCWQTPSALCSMLGVVWCSCKYDRHQKTPVWHAGWPGTRCQCEYQQQNCTAPALTSQRWFYLCAYLLLGFVLLIGDHKLPPSSFLWLFAFLLCLFFFSLLFPWEKFWFLRTLNIWVPSVWGNIIWPIIFHVCWHERCKRPSIQDGCPSITALDSGVAQGRTRLAHGSFHPFPLGHTATPYIVYSIAFDSTEVVRSCLICMVDRLTEAEKCLFSI